MAIAPIVEISKANFEHMDLTHKLAALAAQKAGHLSIVDRKNKAGAMS